jgi:hypothetical protein
MHAFLYGNSGVNNIIDSLNTFEVKTVAEHVLGDEDNNIAFYLSKEVNYKVDKFEATPKVIPTFKSVVLLHNLYFLTFLIVVFIFFYTILFNSLPDDWTLLNQKVRLND